MGTLLALYRHLKNLFWVKLLNKGVLAEIYFIWCILYFSIVFWACGPIWQFTPWLSEPLKFNDYYFNFISADNNKIYHNSRIYNNNKIYLREGLRYLDLRGVYFSNSTWKIFCGLWSRITWKSFLDKENALFWRLP